MKQKIAAADIQPNTLLHDGYEKPPIAPLGSTQVRALDLGSCSSALHSKDTKGYVIPPGQPGKRDRNIENEKTNFFVGVPKLCGLNTMRTHTSRTRNTATLRASWSKGGEWAA
eukprot:scaffold15119_cov141-Skeletonema_marinoi.AAC.1